MSAQVAKEPELARTQVSSPLICCSQHEFAQLPRPSSDTDKPSASTGDEPSEQAEHSSYPGPLHAAQPYSQTDEGEREGIEGATCEA